MRRRSNSHDEAKGEGCTRVARTSRIHLTKDDTNTIVFENYSTEPVRLTNVNVEETN